MSEHEASSTQTASPIEDHTPAPAAGEMPVALATLGAAGNAAVARQMSGSGSHLAGLSVAGNAAVRRAVGAPGQGGGAAPSGFTGRLGSAEAGRPIPDEHRQTLESSFGTSLGDVRLHIGSQSSQLASEVSANAFTVNKDIYFGEGQYSPGSQQGYHLLAHEVTHTLQQGGAVSASSASVSDPADASEREAEDVAKRVTRQRSAGAVHGTAPDVARDATDLIPDFILDGVRSAISAIPGYDLLAGIIGKDPITDQPVQMSRTQLIEKLLTYGPFGANVGQVLQAVDVLGDVYTLVTDGLSANNLTMARIERDIGAAWDELSVTNGIDGNAAIVRRYVDAILHDVSGFVGGIVDQVIEKVRAVVAEVAEPHLQSPQVKPVWDLARKVLHYDPLRGNEVNASTVEILGDFLRLIGKEQVLAQMTERGTLQQAADWLDTQFATFVSIKNDLLQLFADAWAAISPQNLPRLLDTLPPLAQRAFDLVKRIGDFAWTVISKALELIKTSLLGWLSQHAHEMPGFRLMTVMIQRNPFTGDAVPRTAANLIGGFIALLPNGEATYQQLAESGVIDQAAGRIESAMARLNITTDLITGTFLGIWNSLTLEDLLAPIPAFERVLARFQDPLNRILEFVTEVVQVVIELILKLMNFPSDLIGSIISNAAAAIEDIQRDPVAFLLNMLQALKSGFMGFFDNILPFLLDGLTSWLFRGLGQIGITRPADLSLESILGLALQVLGITADSLWQKVGEHIGPERMQQMRGGVDRLTGAWQFIKDVQQGGAAAIWQYVTDRLSGLWDTIVEMAKNWIMSEIVDKVTAKLISMLDPTGVMAVINSFIAFFNAIQSAIEYLRDILTIVNEYVTTFAQVAAGNIAPGAQKITQGLGHAVPIAIGFLANQVGIGNIPEKIVEIITGLREMVDQAIDWLIQQAISLGQSAMGALGIGGEQPAADQPPGAPGDDMANRPIAMSEHPALADRVIGEVVQSAAGVQDPAQAMEAAKAKAHTLEERYNPNLQDNIRLRVAFENAEQAAADGEIDFDVIIAPNTTTKPGKIPLTKATNFDGTTLTVDGTAFIVGSQVQVYKSGTGNRPLPAPVHISAITIRADAGNRVWVNFRVDTSHSLYRNQDNYPSGLFADTYGDAWHRFAEELATPETAWLLEQNARPDWDSDVTAKKVLNYRVSGNAMNNRAGYDWEHIVEQHAFAATVVNTYNNLCLATSTANSELAAYYNEEKSQADSIRALVPGMPSTPIRLRQFLRQGNFSFDIHNQVKREVYRLLRLSLSTGTSDRGTWQELR